MHLLDTQSDSKIGLKLLLPISNGTNKHAEQIKKMIFLHYPRYHDVN